MQCLFKNKVVFESRLIEKMHKDVPTINSFMPHLSETCYIHTGVRQMLRYLLTYKLIFLNLKNSRKKS